MAGDDETQAHPLTEAEQSLIADIQGEQRMLEHQLQGVLRLALRARGLKGTYALNGANLVGKEPEP